MREKTVRLAFACRPEDILWRAVSGMIPKNNLRAPRLRKLLIFPGEHDLHNVEFTEWTMPRCIAKKTKERQGIQAPFKKKP